MTLQEAKKLYIGAGGPDEHSSEEWEEIHQEMESLVDAPSDRAGGRLIDWWGCWSPRDTATAFAKRARHLYREMGLPKSVVFKDEACP